MLENKQLNNEQLEKVSGGAPEYQEGWEIHSTIDGLYCPTCQKEVKGVVYKQGGCCIYCSICHDLLNGLE